MQRKSFLGALGAGIILAAAALSPASAQTAAEDIDTSIVLEMTMGSPDAPIQVIEYSSYTCPYCKRFHTDVFEHLKNEYIDTGKVHLTFREVYFDRPGLWAAMVARCGGPERFFGINEMLFDTQEIWSRGEPADVVASLRQMANSAGINDAEFDACLSDGVKAQAMVALYQQNAQRDGIRSTPSFLIDGRLEPNMSLDEFRELFDSKLEN